MADLGRVRVRALFNETDIGQVRPGQTASVTVDAFPDRRFQGVVEKIEPSATIQQNVTMFPVLVTLDNSESLLKPGMNGEVVGARRSGERRARRTERRTEERPRGRRDGADARPQFDSVTAEVRAQMQSGFGRSRAGASLAQEGRARVDSHRHVATVPSNRSSRRVSSNRSRDWPGTAADRGDRQAVRRRKSGARQEARSTEEARTTCARRRDLASSISRRCASRVRSCTRGAGIDMRVAGACRRKEMQANGGGMGAPGGSGGGGVAQRGGTPAGPATARRCSRWSREPAALDSGDGRHDETDPSRSRLRRRQRAQDLHAARRYARRGNFDYTEVVSGPEGRRAGRTARVAGAPGATPTAERPDAPGHGRPGVDANAGPGGGAGGRPGGGGAGGAPRGGGALGDRSHAHRRNHHRRARRAARQQAASLLTMLGIVIGVAAVIAMVALGTGAQQAVKDRIAALGTTLLTVNPGQQRGSRRALSRDGRRQAHDRRRQGARRARDARCSRVQPEMQSQLQVVSGGNKNTNTHDHRHDGRTTSRCASTRSQSGSMFTAAEDEGRQRVAVRRPDGRSRTSASTTPEALLGENDPHSRDRSSPSSACSTRRARRRAFGNPDDQILDSDQHGALPRDRHRSSPVDQRRSPRAKTRFRTRWRTFSASFAAQHRIPAGRGQTISRSATSPTSQRRSSETTQVFTLPARRHRGGVACSSAASAS